MMEERYHATTQDRFYPDMSNVNKNITVEATYQPTYVYVHFLASNMSLCCYYLGPTEFKLIVYMI